MYWYAIAFNALEVKEGKSIQFLREFGECMSASDYRDGQATKQSRAMKLKIRPDLDDESWLKLIERLPENKDLPVRRLYRRMLRWCEQKLQTPTRRRFLKWLDNERDAVPIKNTNPIAARATMNVGSEGVLRTGPVRNVAPGDMPNGER